jgi:WD40 repeat protein
MICHVQGVTSVCLTPDCLRICSESADKTLRVWDIDTGECMNVYEKDVSSKESRYYFTLFNKFNREVRFHYVIFFFIV